MKKRILFVNNSSRLGIGTSASLLLLLKYLHAEFDCAVVSDKHSSQLPEALAGLDVHHYALPDRLIYYLPALVNLILRDKYDLIYANGSNERSRGAFWAARITGRPLIWHVRESLSRKKYAATIRFADRVVANSRDTAERLLKYANVTNPLIVANGVDIQPGQHSKEEARRSAGARLGLRHNWLRVVNIGRICPDKNQADFIRIANQVVARFPNTYFIMVGAPEVDYFDVLNCLVADLNLKDHVIFSGYIPDVLDILQGCDVMLHVSKKESQGRVLLEAMSVGLPVVACEVGGIGEAILEGETGYLQPYGDLNGLAQAVCSLLGNQIERQRMGSLGFCHVMENFNAENIAQSVKGIITRVWEERVYD